MKHLAKQQLGGKRLLLLLPIGIFLLLLILMVFGLNNDPRTIPSALIGKPAPQIILPELASQRPTDIGQRLSGNYWLLNIWASWCVACRQEHPVLMDISRQYPKLPIVGLNYKDAQADAIAWLDKLADPYLVSVQDIDGRVAIEFGVYGVPETFLIDSLGRIAYKHIGPITSGEFASLVLPLIPSEYR